MINLGIDLGTTYSLVSYVNSYGQPTLFPDALDANQFRTPSVAYVGPEGILVGNAAEALLDDVPELPVVRFVKSRLGVAGWKHLDHKSRAWSAEALSGLILKKLLGDAEMFINDDVGLTVVTVPAQFNDDQRKATQYAARLAGLRDIRLVEEPVAAATHYGLDMGAVDRTLLVFDFGGGTFDVSVLQTGPNGLYVLAADGVSELGGRNIDETIMSIFNEECLRRLQCSAIDDPGTCLRLRRLAEQAKLKLGQPGQVQFGQSMLLKGVPLDLVITRAQLEKECAKAISRCIEACERCLQQAGLGWREVDNIVLTGGSSLLPGVMQSLQAVSGKKTSEIVIKQPHQAVAYGAAALAQRMGSHDGGLEFRQVSGFDLSLRVWDPVKNAPGLEVLLRKNSPLPAKYSRTFYTNRDGQTRMILELVQCRGEPRQEFSLGHYSFGPILNARANHPIEVTVALDREGLLKVEARDPASGRSIEHAVDREGRGVREEFGDEYVLVQGAKINV